MSTSVAPVRYQSPTSDNAPKSLIEETLDYLATLEELEASKAYGPNYILGAIGDEPGIEE